MSLPKLREIDAELMNILSVDPDELDDEQKAAFQPYMNELLQQKADKIDAIVSYIRIDLDGEAEAIGKEIDRLKKRKKSLENREVFLKSLVVNSLQMFGLTKIKGEAYKVWLSETASVDMLEGWEKILPDHLSRCKTAIEPDKKAILDRLKAGEAVPGARLKTTVSLRTS